MSERRRIELADPNQIAQWANAFGTRWLVVAIDLDNGALHLERVFGPRPEPYGTPDESPGFNAAKPIREGKP